MQMVCLGPVCILMCMCIYVCIFKLYGSGYFGQLTKAVVAISDQSARCAVAVV